MGDQVGPRREFIQQGALDTHNLDIGKTTKVHYDLSTNAAANTPWAERWDFGNELGAGGQGTTYLVRDQSGTGLGVLKLLKRQNDSQARKRMRLEVDTLELLSDKGASVPGILDANVDKADDINTPLYFVMQHIEGQTLDEFVKFRKGLSLDQSLELTLQIADAINVGHLDGFGHRDLKPKNIMVSARSDDAAVATILDYGLSFNEATDEGLTRSSENIWNEFLSLPETNIAGGRRRDLRIDIAHLCGLLFFCLTGHYPQLLRDGEERPPHKRPGMDLRTLDQSSDAYLLLDALFTRGFRQRVNDRFQSIDEFLTSLHTIRACKDSEGSSISAIAHRESELLRLHDRATQAEQAKPRCEKLFGQLIAAIGASYKGEDLKYFKIKHRSENLTGIESGGRLQLDWLYPSDRVWVLLVPPHQRQKEIAYGLGICANEFKVARYIRNANPGGWEIPEIVVSYPIDDEPTFAEVVMDFKQWLRRSIQDLRREILPAINA